MGISGRDNNNSKYIEININIERENKPKNFKFYSKDINNFEIEYIWEFILDNQNISIIYNHNLKSNERKILFNKKLIKKEIFNKNKYTYKFYEKGHNYKIIHENEIPGLYIEFKYFKPLNLFNNNNDTRDNINCDPAPQVYINNGDSILSNKDNINFEGNRDYGNIKTISSHKQTKRNNIDCYMRGIDLRVKENYYKTTPIGNIDINYGINYKTTDDNNEDKKFQNLINNKEEELEGSFSINIKFFNLKTNIYYPIKNLF